MPLSEESTLYEEVGVLSGRGHLRMGSFTRFHARELDVMLVLPAEGVAGPLTLALASREAAKPGLLGDRVATTSERVRVAKQPTIAGTMDHPSGTV